MTNVGEFSQIGFAIGGGFFAGILIGYALKKVVKVVAVVVGLFFAGLAYLQYHLVADASNNTNIPPTIENRYCLSLFRHTSKHHDN